jgi:integrase
MKSLPQPTTKTPWNKEKLIGQLPPLKLKEVWAIRTHLQINKNTRDLALFNLAIASKLRSCDLVTLKVRDISISGSIAKRAMIIQQKTKQPVQFEITQQTRDSLQVWISNEALSHSDHLFPSRNKKPPHLSTRQYSRIVKSWVSMIGLNPETYGTHSMRRTKATIIYRHTKNLRAVQLLLGHTKLESTVRYLGVEVDDVLEIAERIEI